jgi:transposase
MIDFIAALAAKMAKRTRPIHSPEFRLEAAQLAVDQGYIHQDASKAMGVGNSTLSKWFKQLREEREGKSPKAMLMTPEQLEIRELKKRIERVEGLAKSLNLLFVKYLPSLFYVLSFYFFLHGVLY